ncbi:hypothetical protein F0562_018185 [Nyssa sinensis]|uniref:Uncharacterized protein n=1 Tax=Nyssa sinensis TaxID=561372 RepID=A0A5J4ZBR0_9ASTE|nr:hypothetical protein F0562_018185 [Nyssa sinensis]
MAPRQCLATEDQFPFAISLVSHPRNPPLSRSTTARTRHPVIQGCEFWPECPIDEPLVRDFYANLETLRDQVTTKPFIRGIAFDITSAFIIETLAIFWEDQPSFPYPPSTAPREEVLARALCRDRCTLMQYELHVGPVTIDVVKDMEADAANTSGGVLDKDYLVNQTPHQYRRDPSPPRPFYRDPGASSSSAHPLVTRRDLKEYFQQLLFVMAIDLHSLIPNDEDNDENEKDDDDDDGDDGDDGDFTPDTSTA